MAADAYLPPLVTELKADVSGLRKGIAEAREMVKKYKEDVDGLGGSFKGTKTEVEKTGKAISDFERLVQSKMRASRTVAGTVREEYEKITKRVRELRDEVKKSGDKSAFAEMGKLTADAAKLGKIGSELGIDLGTKAAQGFGAAMAATGPYVQAAVVAAIVTAATVAAPLVGGLLSAGIVAGLGAGVIGIAAMILKDDKGVQKAWERLTKTTSSVFERSAQSMKKPFIETLGWLEKEFKKLEPDLSKMFDAASPLVQPLAEGLFGMLKNALPGITKALKDGEPVFKVLADKLPIIGTAFGKMLEAITRDPEALATVLGDGITIAAGFIVILGEVLGWLTRTYTDIRTKLKEIKDWFVKLPDEIKKALGNTGAWLTGSGKDLVQGFINGVKSKLSEMKTFLSTAFGGAAAVVKDVLQSKSPSRVFERIGRDTVAGYTLGIQRSAPEAWAATAGLVAPQGAGRFVAGPPALAANRAVAVQSGGARSVAVEGVAHVYLDGREIQQAGIRFAQRDKIRNNNTGWE